jgi:catechol 2,3-dioxygenase-like lactoylglutathione lyase family enzyme
VAVPRAYHGTVIGGLHLMLYSRDAAADRAFLRDVLGWPYAEDTETNPGWLIFKTPPAELGVHPADAPGSEVYLVCDDLDATVAELAAAGVPVGDVQDRGFGTMTSVELPSGARIGLYQPRHPTAYDM